MTFKLSNFVLLVYLSFAFDSALKVGAGIQIHLGILAVLFFNFVLIISSPAAFLFHVKKNLFYTVFVLYFILSIIVLPHEGNLGLLVYLLISFNLMVYCSATVKWLNKNMLLKFQVILIVTGGVQFLAYKLLGYQISFIDSEHYEKGSSVSHRLRGFFIEPNWFAIALTFNTILLVGKDIQNFFLSNRVVSYFTLLLLVLNGSLATLGILVLIYSIPYFKKSPSKGIILLTIFMSLLMLTFSFRDNIKSNQDLDVDMERNVLNHSSRLIPFERVIEYQADEEIFYFLFGQGVGSWATIAIPNRLSVLVFESTPGVRDGSEIPVFLFELGLVGLLLLIIDGLILFLKCDRGDFHYKGAIILFFICMLLYPTFKFWMYMPFYFYIRARVLSV